jgi:CRP-like cAMP-binding protein
MENSVSTAQGRIPVTIFHIIGQVPLFARLSPDEIDDLAATLQQTTYPMNTILFREGEFGDRFYIVLDGQIEIVKALGTADERPLGLRGAGEFVGEMSLLNRDGQRTASAQVQPSCWHSSRSLSAMLCCGRTSYVTRHTLHRMVLVAS